MEWGILAIAIVFLLVAYVILQGTRATLAYRKAAAAGDLKAIRDLTEAAITAWRSVKPPKEVPSQVWRGIQGLDLVDVGPDFVRVSCPAQSEYRLLDGRWLEVANPLEEAMAVTARAADMLLYELPNVRLASIQIDVYTTFRDSSGEAQRSCILSTIARRDAARTVDWDHWTAAEIVAALGGRYRLSDSGQPLPIDPDEGALTTHRRARGAARAAGNTRARARR